MKIFKKLSFLISFLVLILVSSVPAFAASTMPPADSTGTINLTENITLSETYYIPTGVSTINLNGFTVSIATGPCIALNNASSNVVINGGINSEGKLGTISCASDNSTIPVFNGTLVLNGVNVQNTYEESSNKAVIQVGSANGGEKASCTITGGSTITNNSENGYGAVVIPGQGTGELNVGNCTITADTAAIGTNGDKNKYQGTPTINIGVNGSNPTLNGSEVGLYLPDAQGKVNIYNGTISGESGIVIAGGELNITGGSISGTGGYQASPAIPNNGPVSTGAGVVIQGANGSISGTGYGDVKIDISGNPTISSQQGYAIQQNNGGTDSENTNSLDSIKIDGGTFTGGGSYDSSPLGTLKANSEGGEPQEVTGYVSSGTFDDKAFSNIKNALNSNVAYTVSNDGSVTYTSSLNKAQQAVINSGGTAVIKTYNNENDQGVGTEVSSQSASFTTNNGTMVAQQGNTLTTSLSSFGTLQPGATVTFSIQSRTPSSASADQENNLAVTTEGNSDTYTVPTTPPDTIPVTITAGSSPISDNYQISASYDADGSEEGSEAIPMTGKYNFTVTPSIDSLYFTASDSLEEEPAQIVKNFATTSGKTQAWSALLDFGSNVSGTNPQLVVKTSQIVRSNGSSYDPLPIAYGTLNISGDEESYPSLLTNTVLTNLYNSLSFSSDNPSVVSIGAPAPLQGINVPQFVFGDIAGTADITASTNYTVSKSVTNSSNVSSQDLDLSITLQQDLTSIVFKPSNNTVYNTGQAQTATTYEIQPTNAAYSEELLNFYVKPTSQTTGNGSLITDSSGNSSAYYFYLGDDNTIQYSNSNTTPGNYTITAVYNGNNMATATIAVSNSNIESVTITQNGQPVTSALNVNAEQTPTMDFDYTYTPTSSTPTSVVWSIDPSTNTGPDGESKDYYASVDPDSGVVTFKRNTSPGSPIKLICTVDGVASQPVTIFITGIENNIEAIEAIEDPLYIAYSTTSSGTYNLTSNVQALPLGISDDLSNLVFSSDNINVSVTPSGVLTTYQNYPAQATITVYDSTNTNLRTSFEVIITAANPATNVTSEEVLNFYYNTDGDIPTTTQNVNAQLVPDETTSHALFTYTSLDTNIATVDDYGNVTAVSEGTTQIRVTATLFNNGDTSSTGQQFICYTTVNVTTAEITSLTLNPTTVNLSLAETGSKTAAITATTDPEEYAEDVSWTIADTNIATLSASSGASVEVTGVAEGQTTITATVGDQTATATVNVSEEPVEPESISLSPNPVYLTSETGPGATSSQQITATFSPAGNYDVTWSITPESVAIVSETGLVTAVSEGTATVTATVGDVSATAKVIVSNNPVVCDGIEITSQSPDYYTITAKNVQKNPALDVTGSVNQVAMFTWSTVGSNGVQNDMQCKQAIALGNGDWVWSDFSVNDTYAYYNHADSIIVNVYGSLVPGQNGHMIGGTYYKSVNNMNAQGYNDAYIAYCQNIGFDLPSILSGNTTSLDVNDPSTYAGTVGQVRQMEGARISSNIEGVGVSTQVHVENIGWQDPVNDGEYAGTMHRNLQIESMNLSLYGANSSQYTIQYRVHQENLGWSAWVSGGTEAGVTGQHLQLEAYQVRIVPVGTPLPTN